MKRFLLTVALAAGLCGALTVNSAEAQEPFLGEIRYFGGNFAPRGWALCNGQLMAINNYQALYSILGTTYGGDGRTTFALPDARGRAIIHPGNGPGLSTYTLGEKGGIEQIIQTTAQMASHTHTGKIKGANTNGAAGNVAGAVMANNGIYAGRTTPDTDMAAGSVQTDPAGGSQAMSNIQPYETTNCMIAIQGLFPSRN